MSQDQHWQQQIQHLTQQQSWEELDALYENLIAQASEPSQKMFYIWERANLLCDQCQEFEMAIKLLCNALLENQLVDTIIPKVESIKYQALQVEEYSSSQVMHLLSTLLQVYQELIQNLSEHPSIDILYQAYQNTHDLYVKNTQTQPLEMQATAIDVHHQAVEPIQQEAIVDTDQQSFIEEPIQRYEDTEEVLEEAILLEDLDTDDQLNSPRLKLVPQDTALSLNAPDLDLLDQLLDADPRADAMGFLVDLEALCNLRTLTFEEQEALEKSLWIAAETKQQWRKWVQIYGHYFAPHAIDSSMAAQRTFKLASIYETYLQENTTAVELYKEVLGYEPDHIEAFDRLHVILSEQKRWKELTDTIGRIVEHRQNPDEKFDLYLMQGDLFRNQMNSHAKAVSAWFQALEIEAESRQIFVRLLEVYQQTEKWNASIKVLKKLVKLETNHEKRAYYTYTVGLIYRDQLKDYYLAVRTFDEALDYNPSFLKAFQAIDDLLNQENDIARKDRYYRKMLIRAVNHDFEASMIAELALQVGEINLHQLQEWEEAKRAYELVLNYRPSDMQAFQNLTHIYRHIYGADEAIQHVFQWVRRHPTHTDAYQHLYRLTADYSKFDWAWCIAAVLQVLQVSDGESHRFLIEGQSRMSTRLQRALNPAEWKMVIWAQQDESWSQAIALSTQMSTEILAEKPKTYKIHPKKDRINIEPNYTFGRVLHYIGTHLNLTIPTLWAGKFEQGQMLEVVNFGEIGLIVDEHMLSHKNVEEMVAYLTYGLYLSQAQSWLIASSQSDKNIDRLKELASWSRHLKKAQQNPEYKLGKDHGLHWPLKHKNLSDLQKEHLSRIPELDPAQAKQWISGIEQTAYRIALLMSARLHTVVELMKNQPSISGDSFETRLYKLLLFAVSPAYVELRQSLQLTLSIDV